MGYERGASRLGGLAAPPTIAEWRAAVYARGNVPTVFPDGPYVGQPAERYRDASSHFRYALPPANIRELYAAEGRSITSDKMSGQVADVATAILQPFATASDVVLKAPRDVISKTLGIPPFLVTIGLVTAGAFLFRNYLGSRR